MDIMSWSSNYIRWLSKHPVELMHQYDYIAFQILRHWITVRVGNSWYNNATNDLNIEIEK